MQVGIKDGGDGVRCWNAPAVKGYADEVNHREQRVAQDNPDVTVLPGKLVCYGCEVMEYDYGVKCTATLTRTRFAVQGEIEPRPEDAKGSLLDIPGFQGRAPSDIEAEAKAKVTTAPPTPTTASPSDRPRSGLRGLFNR